jgi:DNA-3-methyladenine glycosylase
VYRYYGLHHLFNVVADEEGVGAAVLVRAAEPLAGLERVRARRGGLDGPALLTGPGKVGQALALDPSWSHHPLFEAGGLWIAAGEPVADVIVGPRVGVDYAAPEHRDAPWRLAVAGSRWVSHRRGLAPPRIDPDEAPGPGRAPGPGGRAPAAAPGYDTGTEAT